MTDKETKMKVAGFLAESWGVTTVPALEDQNGFYDFSLVRMPKDPYKRMDVAIVKIDILDRWNSDKFILIKQREFNAILDKSLINGLPAYLVIYDKSTGVVRALFVRQAVKLGLEKNPMKNDRNPNLVIASAEFREIGTIK